jgi:hypothetical protein
MAICGVVKVSSGVENQLDDRGLARIEEPTRMKLYTCIVLFDLSRRPRLLDAPGSRYPDFRFTNGQTCS